jgi:ABC-type lipoprotein release transport system permease subunit
MFRQIKDKPMAILLTVGFSVSFFVLLNSASLVNSIKTENDSVNDYKYSETVMLSPQGQSDAQENYYIDMIKEIIKYLSGLSGGNIYFSDVNVFYNDETANYTCTIDLKNNEASKYIDENNQKISLKQKYSVQNVIIGETLADHLNIKNSSDYFYLDNNKCKALGIKKNSMSGKVDNTSCFIWCDCNNNTKESLYKYLSEELKTGFLELTIKSDKPIEQEMESVCSELNKKYDLDASVYNEKYKGDYQNYWYQFYSWIFSVTSLVFSVFTIFAVSELWMMRRKKEIAIRKAFGYDNRKLFNMLVCELGVLSVPSFVVSLVLQSIYNLLTGSDLKISYSTLLCDILIILSGMVLIILMTVEHSLGEISKDPISETIRSDWS